MTEKEKEIIKKHYENSYWLDYYLKNLDSVVEIGDKYYWGIEKPSIKTSFCFGHGFCGVSTEEEEKRALSDYRSNDKEFIKDTISEIISDELNHQEKLKMLYTMLTSIKANKD